MKKKEKFFDREEVVRVGVPIAIFGFVLLYGAAVVAIIMALMSVVGQIHQ